MTRATDSDAKANARTAQTAIETYAVDNGGKYTGATLANLADIEGTITGMDVAAPTVTDDTYSVVATSRTG